VLVRGRSIGQRIGAGRARIVAAVEDMPRFQAGEVLVADMTDPDWDLIMKRAAAIVTNRGGRTCHAAIVARELGVPAVVGRRLSRVPAVAGSACYRMVRPLEFMSQFHADAVKVGM
jgi:phosphoenolpyruvate synthase/pyruvate phosphate dikinase